MDIITLLPLSDASNIIEMSDIILISEHGIPTEAMAFHAKVIHLAKHTETLPILPDHDSR